MAKRRKIERIIDWIHCKVTKHEDAYEYILLRLIALVMSLFTLAIIAGFIKLILMRFR